LDPYLNLWDERFHALVAKNLLQHPLTPTLYNDPVISMNYDRWDRSIIWLHKQPLFLWQMALSYKLFGISEFTTRLPSVVLGCLLLLISYRTGKLLMNENVGFFTAFLFGTSYYLVELISSRIEVDHNDVSFLFYVSASIWAWLEYISSRSKIRIFLIGLFSAFAILCKWMVGLSVYSGWLIYAVLIFFNKERNRKPATRSLTDLLFALFTTIAIVLPWQLYILHHYPTEALLAYKAMAVHFTSVVEGHGARWWFYLENLKVSYGIIGTLLLPFALFITIRKMKSKPVAISFFVIPLFVYLFFTLAVTKMSSYTFMVSLPILISVGSLMDDLFGYIRRIAMPEFLRRLCLILILSVFGFINLRYFTIREKQSLSGPYMHCSSVYRYNKKVFESLKTSVPSNAVVFNLKGRTYIDCMFYSGLPAYNFIPTIDQYRELKRKNKIPVIFNHFGQKLPTYLQEDRSIIIRSELIRSCDEE
jgi:4-amino-4-deoxy-L-arabinose transferase